MRLFIEVALCAFALYGAWSAFHTLVDTFFSSEQLTVAIRVYDETSRAALETLLIEAREVSWRGGTRVIVLFDRSLLEDGLVPRPEDEALLRDFGAGYLAVDP